MKKNKINNRSILMLILMAIILLPSTVRAISFTVSSERGTKDSDAYRITNKANLTIQEVADNDVLKAFGISNIYYNNKTNDIYLGK